MLAKRLSYDTIQPFVNLQEERDEKGKLVNPYIKGVWFEKEYQRQYPYGKLASSVIGFTTSGNLGINGLENYYDGCMDLLKEFEDGKHTIKSLRDKLVEETKINLVEVKE